MKKSISLTRRATGWCATKRHRHEPNTIRNYRTTFAKLQAYFASHPERSCILSGGPRAAGEEQRSRHLHLRCAPAQVQVRIPRSMRSRATSSLTSSPGCATSTSASRTARPRAADQAGAEDILNIHTDLSALWSWGVEEGFVPANIVRTIAPPDPKAPVVETLTKEEINALLGACERSKTWKEPSSQRQRTSDRRSRPLHHPAAARHRLPPRSYAASSSATST